MLFKPLEEQLSDTPRKPDQSVASRSGTGSRCRLEDLDTFMISQSRYDRCDIYTDRNTRFTQYLYGFQSPGRPGSSWLHHSGQFTVKCQIGRASCRERGKVEVGAE